MNFIKTFLITLGIYIGLNAIFLVVSIFISPGFPLSDILFVISTLFSPIATTPGTTFMVAVALTTTFDLLTFLAFLALFVPPLVAMIVGARLGDNSKMAFKSWLGTAVISCLAYYLILLIGQFTSPLLVATWVSLGGFLGASLYVVIGGMVNGFFYGCFSFLFSKS